MTVLLTYFRSSSPLAVTFNKLFVTFNNQVCTDLLNCCECFGASTNVDTVDVYCSGLVSNGDEW